ncbi:hypothetical protein LCGC14_2268250, partial [marine sediment metagenome]
VLDNRIAGGAYDFYSSRSFRPELRPYLEIELSPAAAPSGKLPAVRLAGPKGDYWVEPMRQVHKKYKGRSNFRGRGGRGSLAQYGDSITVTTAFLGPYGGGEKIEVKNASPEVAAEIELRM